MASSAAGRVLEDSAVSGVLPVLDACLLVAAERWSRGALLGVLVELTLSRDSDAVRVSYFDKPVAGDVGEGDDVEPRLDCSRASAISGHVLGDMFGAFRRPRREGVKALKVG